MNQHFKRQLKTPTSFVSFVNHPQGVLKRASLKLLEMFCVRSRWWAAWNVVCVSGATRHTRHTHHRSKFHNAKHRLRTQNISSNFSEASFNTPWGWFPKDPKLVGAL